MIRVTYGSVTVAGGDAEQFAFALSQVAEVAKLAKELGANVSPLALARPVASGLLATGNKGANVAEWMRQETEKAERNGTPPPQRFRRSREELAAGLSEEQAAAARLAGGGEGGGVTYDPNAPSEGASGAEGLSLADIEHDGGE